ncbi:MAG TPA: hypothetical protein VHJ19_05270 [Gammaproteobacteria bacterium]|nr:hypothetical protein [Gammaproteobacteria bacterium]
MAWRCCCAFRLCPVALLIARRLARARPRGGGQAACGSAHLRIGPQILVDLGVQQMRLLSPPKRYHGLGGFGLQIVEQIPD